MIAIVYPAIPHSHSGRQKEINLHAGILQSFDECRLQLDAPQPVADHPHLDPFPSFANHHLCKGRSDHVAAKDVKFKMDMIPRLLHPFQHRAKSLLSGGVHFRPVSARNRVGSMMRQQPVKPLLMNKLGVPHPLQGFHDRRLGAQLVSEALEQNRPPMQQPLALLIFASHEIVENRPQRGT
ncbi:hypothetical protein D3C74_283990 [compost metagenome]